MNEVTFDELGTQRAELLPARETLWAGTLNVLDVSAYVNLAAVSADNVSQAVNAVAVNSSADSYADQYIDIWQ